MHGGQAVESVDRTTICELLEAYLLERMVRPATADTYQKAINRWVEETGVAYLDGIRREDVLRWRNAILARARPETWNKYRRHLRAVLNYGVQFGYVRVNHFSDVPPARTGMRLKKTVDVELLKSALCYLEGIGRSKLRPAWFWATVIRAFYYTGIRRLQLTSLRWEDINLTAGTVHLRAETCKTHREWYLPLSVQVVEDLAELQRRTTRALGRPPEKDEQVFNVTLFYCRYKGPTMNEDQLGGFFRRLSEAMNDKITPHRLRHTMATALAIHGDIRTLQEILGHTNLSTTMCYVHPDIERMRQLVVRLPCL